jgi:hypothetical protein
MSSIREFLYDDQKITFEFNDGQSMVNATQMAKPFGKLPTGFLRGESAKAFVLALEEDYRKNAPPPQCFGGADGEASVAGCGIRASGWGEDGDF